MWVTCMICTFLQLALNELKLMLKGMILMKTIIYFSKRSTIMPVNKGKTITIRATRELCTVKALAALQPPIVIK